jgi:hypothetical protein
MLTLEPPYPVMDRYTLLPDHADEQLPGPRSGPWRRSPTWPEIHRPGQSITR